MANLIVEIFSLVLLGILIIALCMGTILLFALKVPFFQKIYLFIFEHDDWRVYRETKRMLKYGEEIPILAPWSPFENRNGICFIVSVAGDKRYVSVWKDGDCQLTYGFHKPTIDDLLKYGNIKECIEQKQQEFTEYWEERRRKQAKLEEHLAQLKAEYKEKFGVDYDEEHSNEQY